MPTTRCTQLAATAALTTAALMGCSAPKGDHDARAWNNAARRDTNAWMIRTYQGQQVENAITRQHTIWSHHFVEGTTALTPRAQRDLGVLRDHYIRHGGGVLTVRQGEAGDELFASRLEKVTGWLADAGVPMDTVAIEHGLFTGDGKRSTRAATDYVKPSEDEPYSFHEKKSQ